RAMVTRFGMSKRFGLMGLETVESEYLDRRGVMNCADVTAAGIDEEVMQILKDSYTEAKRLLLENRDVMDKIADFLIEKETITGHQFMEIYCREKGIPMPVKDRGEESLRKLHESEKKEEESVETKKPTETEDHPESWFKESVISNSSSSNDTKEQEAEKQESEQKDIDPFAEELRKRMYKEPKDRDQ
ncbi:MAG TPA: hypothetical protein PLZ77_00765, partial [Lachnospiraceae bacterium]|nr:hypothetical protein [Lachnospiraceae bacterium]